MFFVLFYRLLLYSLCVATLGRAVETIFQIFELQPSASTLSVRERVIEKETNHNGLVVPNQFTEWGRGSCGGVQRGGSGGALESVKFVPVHLSFVPVHAGSTKLDFGHGGFGLIGFGDQVWLILLCLWVYDEKSVYRKFVFW